MALPRTDIMIAGVLLVIVLCGSLMKPAGSGHVEGFADLAEERAKAAAPRGVRWSNLVLPHTAAPPGASPPMPNAFAGAHWSPECCTRSPYSTSGGCPCPTTESTRFFRTRGGNVTCGANQDGGCLNREPRIPHA